MNNINFTSRIRPVSKVEFNKELQHYTSDCASVYPWTIKQSVYKPKVYTQKIGDCYGCIIKDYYIALLAHLCPDEEANMNFKQIENFITTKIDFQKKGIEAFLIGAKSTSRSNNFYTNMQNFLSKNKIPFSELKYPIDSDVSVAYRSDKDELLVCHDFVEKYKKEGLSDMEILKKCFGKVSIADCDEVQKNKGTL